MDPPSEPSQAPFFQSLSELLFFKVGLPSELNFHVLESLNWHYTTGYSCSGRCFRGSPGFWPYGIIPGVHILRATKGDRGLVFLVHGSGSGDLLPCAEHLAPHVRYHSQYQRRSQVCSSNAMEAPAPTSLPGHPLCHGNGFWRRSRTGPALDQHSSSVCVSNESQLLLLRFMRVQGNSVMDSWCSFACRGVGRWLYSRLPGATLWTSCGQSFSEVCGGHGGSELSWT